MRQLEHSALSFLIAFSPEMRAVEMRNEILAALRRDMRKQIRELLWRGLTRPFQNSSEADRARLKYHEWAGKNIEPWIRLDATTKLVDTLRYEKPFALYLRAYAAEGFDEIEVGSPDVVLKRSVEIANVGAVSEHFMPVFGLTNKLDMNLLQKYESVWLPRKFREHWYEVVLEIAILARLIIINATRAGTGFTRELRTIPWLFPEKTWLLAGVDDRSGDFVSDDIKEAQSNLREYNDHVSTAIVSANGEVAYAEPRLPEWVQAIRES
jgi:hypothetical protein